MANVRLVRQSLEDYNSRVAKIDAQYRADYDAYGKQVEDFNKRLQGVPYVTSVGGRHNVVLSNGQAVNGANLGGLGSYYINGQFVKDPTAALGGAPADPVQGAAPRSPNLTNADYAALSEPATDQAGVAKANALGYTGKSELAGDQGGPMRNSAFAKQDDPQGLKDRGILARVIGGQL